MVLQSHLCNDIHVFTCSSKLEIFRRLWLPLGLLAALLHGCTSDRRPLWILLNSVLRDGRMDCCFGAKTSRDLQGGGVDFGELVSRLRKLQFEDKSSNGESTISPCVETGSLGLCTAVTISWLRSASQCSN